MCLQVVKVPNELVKEIHLKGYYKFIYTYIYKKYKIGKGNPFLTEEIIFALRENGGIQITKTSKNLS